MIEAIGVLAGAFAIAGLWLIGSPRTGTWICSGLVAIFAGLLHGPLGLVAAAALIALAAWRKVRPHGGVVLGAYLALTLVHGGSAPAATATASSGGGMGAGDPFGGACKPVMTQPYGPTTFAGEPIVHGVRTHTGIDLACPAGTPIHTVSDGIVHVTAAPGGGFGNNVVVQSGSYFTRYAHLASVAVPNGANVHAGDVIGREGSTGFSTGPHLHFEVDHGAADVQRSIEPTQFLTVTW